MKRDIVDEGISANKLSVMPMGFDSMAFAESQAKPPLKVDANAISYLGTLASERRIDFLVRVLAEVIEDLPNTKLILVGAGDRDGDEQLILNEAKRLGVVDHVVLTGKMPQQDALQAIRATQVCLSPFYPTPILNSTSPTKLVEYMALGKAVVANDHPEQKLIIEASRAGYCVPYDESSFAEAVVTLLKAPQLCDEMGSRGQKFVHRERRYEVLADRLDKVYRRLLGRLD